MSWGGEGHGEGRGVLELSVGGGDPGMEVLRSPNLLIIFSIIQNLELCMTNMV